MVRAEESVAAPETVDDAFLVAKASRGDPAAFDRLFQRHYPKVVGLAVKLSGDQDAALDIAQTAFVRAYRSLRTLRDGQAFEKVLYRAVVNLVRDRAKSARRKPWIGFADLLRGTDADAEPPCRSSSPEQLAIQTELTGAIETAVQSLPLDYREVVVLHHMQQLDVQAIAEVLGIPDGTVKSRLARGRQKLREALGEWLD